MPTNYRGVAVSNALHKLFTKVINTRIIEYMKENGKWTENQSGFMANRRTEDNIMILHSLFHKYVICRNEKLYVAFTDFRKFFDIVNQDHLMYKFIKWGIIGE